MEPLACAHNFNENARTNHNAFNLYDSTLWFQPCSEMDSIMESLQPHLIQYNSDRQTPAPDNGASNVAVVSAAAASAVDQRPRFSRFRSRFRPSSFFYVTPSDQQRLVETQDWDLCMVPLCCWWCCTTYQCLSSPSLIELFRCLLAWVNKSLRVILLCLCSLKWLNTRLQSIAASLWMLELSNTLCAKEKFLIKKKNSVEFQRILALKEYVLNSTWSKCGFFDGALWHNIPSTSDCDCKLDLFINFEDFSAEMIVINVSCHELLEKGRTVLNLFFTSTEIMTCCNLSESLAPYMQHK